MNFFRIGIALLPLLSWAASACDSDWYNKMPIAHYERSHKISYPGEGLVDSNDDIRIFERNAKSLCFVLDTARKNLHVCQIVGEAQKISDNEFEYRDSTCHLRFIVSEEKIRLQVNGEETPKPKNHCKHESCGAYGSIDNATFIKTSNPAPNR
jgi:hypothetical protein